MIYSLLVGIAVAFLALVLAYLTVPAVRRRIIALVMHVLAWRLRRAIAKQQAAFAASFRDDPEVTELGFATRARARPDDGKCWKCAGTGVCKCPNCTAKGLDKCPACGGTGSGRIETPAQMPKLVSVTGLEKCANCKGTGEGKWCGCDGCNDVEADVLEGACSHCGGTGWR
jgi:hypothetical protein